MSKLTKEEEKRIKELIERLKDEAQEVRREAAAALGLIGEKAVPALIEAMKKDEDERVRSEAAWALGEIGEKLEITIPALRIALISEEEKWVRRQIIYALEKFRVKLGYKNRRELLQDSRFMSDEERRAERIEEYLDRLNAIRPQLRKEAIWNLSDLKAEKAVPEIIERLQKKRENKWVRAWAAKALGKIGGKEAVEALKEFQWDKNELVRHIVVKAIVNLEGRNAVKHFNEEMIRKCEKKLEDDRQNRVTSEENFFVKIVNPK